MPRLRIQRLEYQLIMHLKEHSYIKIIVGERRRQPNHGAADDICSRTLYGCIDGLPFAERTLRDALRLNIADVDAPPKNRFDIAMLANESFGLFHVIADAGKPLEIFPDIGIGFTPRDAKLIGKPESRNPVDDAEIDR